MVKDKVCVKWVEDKCVKWETNPEGGITLNLNKCPAKLVKTIKGQLAKGLKVEKDLTESDIN